jgi:psiF repeat
MNMIKTAIAAAALAFAASTGAAVAQTATTTPSTTTKPAVTTPAPTTTTTTAPKAKIGQPKGEISIQCSKEADAKKLHGAERKKFRAKCKTDAEKAAKAAAAPATTTMPAKKN